MQPHRVRRDLHPPQALTSYGRPPVVASWQLEHDLHEPVGCVATGTCLIHDDSMPDQRREDRATCLPSNRSHPRLSIPDNGNLPLTSTSVDRAPDDVAAACP